MSEIRTNIHQFFYEGRYWVSREKYAAWVRTKRIIVKPFGNTSVCENAERENLFAVFQNADTFKCRSVDVYAEIFDMADEQLAGLLAGKRTAIEAELLEAYTTKRRNLYITDVGFFGLNGRIAKRHSVRRLAIDGKESFNGQDKRTDGICFTFVGGVFEELVGCGKIVTAQTKNNGIGYRTAKKGDPR